MIRETHYEYPVAAAGRPLGPINGIPLHLSPHLRDGTVWYAADLPPGSGPIMWIGTRPLTELEAAGREARLIVRHGLADVLEWLGMPLDREPLSAEILAALRSRR